ncbi:restriction endonuclease subunit S [Staphylococcus chromogenes]|uniref:restriction endonuclease subunit S n=1 Tax=Staphylococcus chromogenes TaxID=46126 RepID=UPI002904B015|nr:restriction endonuclease subunit S [Staphylococcus chromogenes]MDU0431142.1 restriction endonuclease subunit S [Staphylococcus chromogenes]
MEFKKYKIEEIGTVVGGGTPSTKNDNYYGGNISWITPKDLSNYSNRYIYHGERNITEEGLNNSSAKLVPTDTILMTSRAPIGYLALAGKKVATNQGFKSIICNEEIVSPKYLYYLLQNKMDNIKSLGTGSTFSEISGKVVKNIEVSLPNLLNQKRVEKVLDSIDEKIELNQKIIANLEELSQTLFKRWFVDFEFPDENGNPYKSSGGEMVDSELGKIPKEWEIVNLNDISLKISKGTTPKKDINTESSSQNIPFFKVKDLSDFYDIKMENVQYISNNTHENLLKRSKLQPQDILLSIAGTIGRIAYVPSTLKNANINQAIGFIRLKNNNYFLYIYNYLKQNDFQNYLTKSVVQAVQANISLKVIKEYKVLIPVNNLINDWDSHIQSLHDKIGIKKNEINQLIQLRDTLLPKLMSGEIEIPDDIEVNEDELSI